MVFAPWPMGRLSQGATLATSYSSYGTYKAAAAAQPATAAAGKPNIVVIWGDDIGQSDISAYTKGTSNWAPWPCGASRFVATRIPWLYNLRTDPYEKATITSNTYWDWYLDHVYLMLPAQKFCRSVLLRNF